MRGGGNEDRLDLPGATAPCTVLAPWHLRVMASLSLPLSFGQLALTRVKQKEDSQKHSSSP